MYFHLITPLAIGAVALAMLTVSLGRNEYAAFVALMLAATSQASNPLEWGYPATYLHGPALTSGWAVANCISAYGGAAHGLHRSIRMYISYVHHSISLYIISMIVLHAVGSPLHGARIGA